MPRYFAYGSNLLTQRLVARCPTARPVGRGVVADFGMGFAKYSWMDGSGKATLLAAEGRVTHGVLFTMDDEDVRALDRIEGVGKGYDRIDRLPVRAEGNAVDAISYIATDPRDGQRPFDWYLALILAGARQHRLHPGVIADLAATDWDVDPEPERPGRLAAVDALHAAGHKDWPTLLRTP